MQKKASSPQFFTSAARGANLALVQGGRWRQALPKASAIMHIHHLIHLTKARLLWACAGLALGVVTTQAHANPANAAPEDDILEVVDLPLAVDLAKGSGLSETELQESVEVAREGGMGAAVLSEVLVAESDAVKVRGKKKGLPEWLMTRWAAGARGVDLKGEVKARPEQAKLDAAKKKELKESIKKQRKQRLADRKALRTAIKQQRAAGKPVKLRGKSAHARLKQGKGPDHGKDLAEQAKTAGPNNQAAQKGAKGQNGKGPQGPKGGAKAHGKSDKHGEKAHGTSKKSAAGHGKGKGKGKGKGSSSKKGRGKRK